MSEFFLFCILGVLVVIAIILSSIEANLVKFFNRRDPADEEERE